MAEEVQIFKICLPEELRVIDLQGELYFCGNDVAKMLGHRDAEHMLHILEENKRSVAKIEQLSLF